jgi:hypothetical protein
MSKVVIYVNTNDITNLVVNDKPYLLTTILKGQTEGIPSCPHRVLLTIRYSSTENRVTTVLIIRQGAYHGSKLVSQSDSQAGVRASLDIPQVQVPAIYIDVDVIPELIRQIHKRAFCRAPCNELRDVQPGLRRVLRRCPKLATSIPRMVGPHGGSHREGA